MADDAAPDIEIPRNFELLMVAMEFIEAKRFDYATIAIQTAVEIFVEQQLLMIIGWRNLGPLGDLVTGQFVRPPYNFRDARLRALWTALTADKIEGHDKTWWPSYNEHVKRRNEIVHGGRHATAEDAENSILAAVALMSHVQDITIETGQRLGKVAEVGQPFRSDPDPY